MSTRSKSKSNAESIGSRAVNAAKQASNVVVDTIRQNPKLAIVGATGVAVLLGSRFLGPLGGVLRMGARPITTAALGQLLGKGVASVLA